MSRQHRHHAGHLRVHVWSFVALLAIPAAPGTATALDLPAVRAGMWSFQRTVAGTNTSFQACENPIEKMNQRNEQLKRIGCRFTEPVKSGNTYTFESDCPMPRPKGTARARGKTVITFESDSAYTVDITSDADGAASHDHLVAKRIGDCAQ
jgi:Protein of unknown function (DUF3617)